MAQVVSVIRGRRSPCKIGTTVVKVLMAEEGVRGMPSGAQPQWAGVEGDGGRGSSVDCPAARWTWLLRGEVPGDFQAHSKPFDANQIEPVERLDRRPPSPAGLVDQ